jgi:ABC-type sugar transport system ATPase subunit
VLRDGKLVNSIPAPRLDHATVIKMMVGRDVHEVKSSPRRTGDVVLKVDGLSRSGILEDISFTVRAGEIVTLAGLVGAGRTEVARCIAGIDRYDQGAVAIDGKPVRVGDPKKAINAGIALVPEDRREQALVPKLSVGTNITISLLDRIAPGGVISRSREDEIINEAARSLSIKMASAYVPISTLSGGNQQKAVIGRCVAQRPRLLILDEPTKGVDIGAKAEISEIIIRLVSQGTAVLLISSELPEVLALSDRVLVMRSGRIVGELGRDELSQESVMNLATMG